MASSSPLDCRTFPMGCGAAGLGALATACPRPASSSAPKRRPNILLILTDDLGYDDLGLHGNPRAFTPHLDGLGRTSVRFSNFTVNPVCAPSRATLMTGRHFLRTGVSHVHGGKDFLHPDERTLAQVLRTGGYVTGMWGKWHLGTAPGYCPWERGFDEAYMANLYRHRSASGMLNGKPVSHQGWADAVMMDYALDFVRRHKDRPWFAYLPSMTPHGPHNAPTEYVERFMARGVSEPLAKIFAMVSHLDDQVGRLLAAIEQEGLTQETLVLFLSDNGPAMDRGALSDADRALRKVNGLRGWKGDIWENGVRSPLFIRQGTRFAPAVVDAVAEMPDLFPTLLELAGVNLPADHPKLDGSSLASLLAAPAGGTREKPVFNYANPGWPSGIVTYSPEGIHNEYNPVAPEEKGALDFPDQVVSIRRGPWKLLMNPQINDDPANVQSVWLVKLDQDKGETANLVSEYPEVAHALRRELGAWWQSILRETHSFTAPYYVFPSGAESELIIAGKTPFRCSPTLRNTAQFLKQWHAPGQHADYHVRANESFAVRVRFKQGLPVQSRWRISAGNQAAEALLPADALAVNFPVFSAARDMDTLRLELVSSKTAVNPEAGAWLDALVITAAERL